MTLEQRRTTGWACRRAAGLVLAVAAIAFVTSTVHAQPAPEQDYLLASDAEYLWLAEISPRETRVFRRGITTRFTEAQATLRGRIVRLAARGGAALAFFGDKSFYRIEPPADFRPQRNLPDRGLPVDLLATDAGTYALLTSSSAAALAARRDPNATPTIDPNDAALWLGRYAKQTWELVGPTPAVAPPGRADRNRPRLALMNDQLWVFHYDELEGQLRYDALRTEPNGAGASGQIASHTPVAFWPLTVNRQPQVVLVTRDDTGIERIGVLRHGGGKQLGFEPWEALALRDPNGDPFERRLREYVSVASYNQHLVILAADARDRAYVCYARLDRPPTEETVWVGDALVDPQALPYAFQVQMIAFVLLMSLVAGVFLLRRDSLVAPAVLPPPLALALIAQRLAGGLIDVLPFAIVVGVFEGQGWSDLLRAMFDWARGSEMHAAGLPRVDILRWWALTTVTYSTYCLIMELITGRTIGKVLMQMWVTHESGARPAVWQVLVRNVLRPIELLPPLWALLLLVVLTPRRQRLGDLFARTILVRRMRYHIHVVDKRRGEMIGHAQGQEDAGESRDESETGEQASSGEGSEEETKGKDEG